MAAFVELQKQFVDAQTEAWGGVHLKWQVMQPAFRLPPDDDLAVWSLFNNIPPDAAVHDARLGGRKQLSTNFQAMLSALQSGNTPNDPIFVAQVKLAEIKPAGSQPAGWSEGYADLVRQLAASPSRSFSFDNVAHSLPSNPGFWGLWSGSDPCDEISYRFAFGQVSGEVTWDNWCVFFPAPGDWFSAAAMALAYCNEDGRPWNPESVINWEKTFGENGTLPRFVTMLIVVDGIRVRYRSTSEFSRDQQKSIAARAGTGLWPYYLTGSGVKTVVSFSDTGTLAVSVECAAGSPVVIMDVVSSIAKSLAM